MRIKLHKKFHRLFWRYFASYSLILLLTLALGTLTYSLTLSMVQSDAIETRQAVLEQSRRMIDTRLRETESMVIQLSLDDRVREMMRVRLPLTGADYEQTRQLLNNFPSHNITNEFVYDTLIYFRNSNLLVSERYASSRVNLLFNEYFRFEAIDFETWQQDVINQYHYGTFLNAKTIKTRTDSRRLITYIQSIPIGNYVSYKGAIVVLIDEAQVHQHLSELNLDDRGWCYIQDQNGQVITQLGNAVQTVEIQTGLPSGHLNTKMNGEPMTLVYTTSDYNGWTYVAAFSTQAVMERVDYIRRIYLNTSLAIIIIGFLISLLLAKYNYQPVRQLVSRISSHLDSQPDSKRNEYAFLEATVEKLIFSNEDLASSIKDQLPLLRIAFFERLFRKGFSTNEEIDQIQSHLKLNLKGELFTVVLIRVNGYSHFLQPETLDELTFKRLLISTTLVQQFTSSLIMHNLDQDKLALVLVSQADAALFRATITDLVGRLCAKFHKELQLKVSLAVGSISNNLMGIGASCQHANEALSHVGYEKDTCAVWYEALPPCSDHYDYTLDQQARLMSLTRTGDLAQIEQLLEQICQRNFANGLMPTDLFNQLTYEMRGTANRIFNDLESVDDPTEFDRLLINLSSSQSAEDLLASVKAVYAYLVPKAQQQKSDYNLLLLKKIKVYIDDQTNRKNMHLSGIADHFDLTEKYLSSFFKRMTGENLSTYIEKTNMDNALKLLAENQLSVKEISETVGYYNVNTFYKAFKRAHGMSPSDYKRQLKLED